MGLTSTRKAFRGHVRVSFGESIPLGAYAAAYRDEPAKAVEALTTTIQWGMEAEILNVGRPERQDLVRAVEEIYRSDLIRELQEERGLGTRQIDPLRLSRAIADAAAHFEEPDPARAARLSAPAPKYRAMLRRYHVRYQPCAPAPAARRAGPTSALVGCLDRVAGSVRPGRQRLPYLPRLLSLLPRAKETAYAHAPAREHRAFPSSGRSRSGSCAAPGRRGPSGFALSLRRAGSWPTVPRGEPAAEPASFGVLTSRIAVRDPAPGGAARLVPSWRAPMTITAATRGSSFDHPPAGELSTPSSTPSTERAPW